MGDVQVCSNTVMDNIADPDISFNHAGICNYYFEFSEKLAIRVPSREAAEQQLVKVISRISRKGKGKKYDCIIGVSGGVDSSYVAWIVKQFGLRPLAVHLDNGWDSETAVLNIENILKKLDIDFYTEVLDWEMFRDLQLSFLKASTPDGEIPTDHAILAILYQIASKYKIRYIISGMNFRNEGMLPPSWSRGYLDWKYIKSVHKKFGTKSLKSFPHLTKFSFLYYNLIKGIRSISVLNYIDFNKEQAMKELQEKLGWKQYGGKHYESIYTRFYQSYILPEKFKIDKRKAHYSCRIISESNFTRSMALQMLSAPPAPQEQTEIDKKYVLKKLGLSEEEFNQIMKLPVKTIYDYPNNHNLEKKFRKYLLYFRKLRLLPN